MGPIRPLGKSNEVNGMTEEGEGKRKSKEKGKRKGGRGKTNV
jgi:hypothetical protein